MTLVTVAFALALPWLCGALAVLALPRRETLLASAGGLAWVAGAGWFAGVVLLGLVMRALSLAGIPFGVAPVGAVLAASAAACAWLARPRERSAWRACLRGALATLRGDALAGPARVAWFALLAWLALRAGLLGGEVALRPTYPWEAWTIWATKARVYFEMRALVPFVPADAWLASPGGAWFDATPGAPATVPLLGAWLATTLGRFDDVALGLPWWISALALVLLMFGALRHAGLAPLPALAATWLAASAPLVSAHVALAGYADLFVAGVAGTAGLALLRFVTSRAPGDALLALCALAALPLVKSAGLVWVVALAPGFAAALVPRIGHRVAAGIAVAAVATLVVLARSTVSVGGLALHLDFAPQWAAFGERLFLLDNWHLLWWAVGLAALVGARAVRDSVALRVVAMLTGGGIAYALVLSAFPAARVWFGEPASVNRTLLALLPLAGAFVALAAQDWTARWRIAHAPANALAAAPATVTASDARASAETPPVDAPPAPAPPAQPA